ncbi:MAG: hypothetical protein ACRCZP_16770 [Phycicoccus sp.]
MKAAGDASRALKQVDDGGNTLVSTAKSMAARFTVGLAAMVAASGAAAPAVGAAIAGGIAIGAGAGIAALGLKLAAQSERVKAAWAGVLDPFKTSMREAAKPLEQVLVNVSTRLREFLAGLTGPLDEAFARMAEPLDRFSAKVFEALDKLRPAILPVTDAFNAMLDAVGGALPGAMEDISSGLIKLSDAVEANPEPIKVMVTALGMLVGALLTLLGWLIELQAKMITFWRGVRDAATAGAVGFLGATAQILNGLRQMLDGFFGWQLGALNAARSVASALGLPTGPIDSAIAGVNRLRAQTNAQMQSMINTTYQWISALNSIPRSITVNVRAAASGFSTIPGGNRLGSQGLRAAGGPVSPYGSYQVNERGPEMLSVRGRDYLMMGGAQGRITPADQLGGDITVVVRIGERELTGVVDEVVREHDRALGLSLGAWRAA